MKWIWRKIMAFGNIFKDNNDINEKNVIGFMSFAVMTIFAIVDLTTGYFGKDLVINEFIYNSFVFLMKSVATKLSMYVRRTGSTASFE